jgi:hypothetical protein
MVYDYLQVGEVGEDEIQIVRRRWIQREKSSSRSPDVNRTVHLRKQQLSPSIRISKATASTVIATGNLRQGRLMANHGGLYSGIVILSYGKWRLKMAKPGCARVL